MSTLNLLHLSLTLQIRVRLLCKGAPLNSTVSLLHMLLSLPRRCLFRRVDFLAGSGGFLKDVNDLGRLLVEYFRHPEGLWSRFFRFFLLLEIEQAYLAGWLLRHQIWLSYQFLVDEFRFSSPAILLEVCHFVKILDFLEVFSSWHGLSQGTFPVVCVCGLHAAHMGVMQTAFISSVNRRVCNFDVSHQTLKVLLLPKFRKESWLHYPMSLANGIDELTGCRLVFGKLTLIS